MPRPLHLSLAPGVHAAAVDDDLVFLDAPRDAYSCLPRASPGVTLDVNARGLRVADPQLAEALLDGGLVRRGEPAREVVVWRPPPPSASAWPHSCGPASFCDAPRILRTVDDVRRGYWRRGFADIVGATRGHGPAARAAPSPALLDRVADFHRWSPWAPLPGKCLVRAFALLQYLRRRDLDAQWVFGVATWPFRAHCWLQCGEVALDDAHERLRAFTPILVI